MKLYLGSDLVIKQLQPADKGRIIGIVMESGAAVFNPQPIAGAHVLISGSGAHPEYHQEYITAADGTYRSELLPTGNYFIHFIANGYNPTMSIVNLRNGVLVCNATLIPWTTNQL